MRPLLKALVLIVVLAQSHSIVYASRIFDEVQYISHDFDMYGYIDLARVLQFFNKNGISRKQLASYIFFDNENGPVNDQDRQVFIDLIGATNKILVVAKSQKIDEPHEKIENIKTGLLTFFEVHAFPESVIQHLKSLKIERVHGISLYVFDKKENVYGLIVENLLIIGHANTVVPFAESREKKQGIETGLLQELQYDFNNMTIGVRIRVSKTIQNKMDQAIKEGKRLGSGLDENVFIQALLKLQSIRFSVNTDETLRFNMVMIATGDLEGERLMMFNNFLIVGTSFIVPFSDMLSRSYAAGSGRSLKTTREDLIYIQKVIGRVRTRRVPKGVDISYICTETEKRKIVNKIIDKLEQDKKARDKLKRERELEEKKDATQNKT